MIGAVAFLELVSVLQAFPDGPIASVEWLDGVLATHWVDYTPRSSSTTWVRAWSVGSVLGNETLVQARPVVRDANARFLEDLLRTPAPCTIGVFVAGTVRPGADPPSIPPGGLGRFPRFIGIRSESCLFEEHDASAEKTLRERLRAALPTFLSRSMVGATDRELVFYSFLAALHERGGLGQTYAQPEQIRAALRALDDRLGQPRHLNMMVSDGRTFAMIHRGGTLVAMVPPTADGGRRRRLTTQGVPIPVETRSILFFEPNSDAPSSPDAERVSEGVFSVDIHTPRQLVRDG